MTLIDFPLPVRAGDRRYWGQAIGAAGSCAVADIARQHQGLTLIITSDTENADRLQRELGFFLNGANSEVELLHFPDWETLPYDTFSPHRDIISRRLKTLYQLPSVKQSILIVPVTTLLHRVTPSQWLRGNSLVFRKGDILDRDQYRLDLEAAGYTCVDTVLAHGEYALRGSLLDIFPMGSDNPYRIDLFDDEIDTLRTFDPDTQRSLEDIDSVQLLPAHEFPLDKQSRDKFRERYREEFDVDYRECPMYLDIGKGIASPGIEYFLDLFFEQTETLFEHLPRNTLVVTDKDLQTAIPQFLTEARSRYENHRVNPERPLLSPERVFLGEDELFSKLLDYPRIRLTNEAQASKSGRENIPARTVPVLAAEPRREQPLQKLLDFLNGNSRVLFTAESPGRRESLLELLSKAGIRPETADNWQHFLAGSSPIAITVAPLDTPLWLEQPDIALITESQLLGGQVMQRRRRKSTTDHSDQIIRNLSELREGAPVVHLDHGIGRYRGLQTIEVDQQPQEFLQLEYADEAKLYVPVSSLHLIARFTGADDALAPMSRLGNEQWSKARRKAAEKARDSAAELLDIYARREAKKGYAFPAPDAQYDAFSAAFPFEATPDQETSINSVVADMTAGRPMDRLVCGDVGFGKTEVAMRAAFIAVNAGRQVAILVPTTLLAQQHYESFRDRFADWAINIEVISRFKTAKQVTEMKQKLSDGKIDIIIGTHKLLQPDIHFSRLGLLIIDEEHRFGVRHKDRLKSLRSEVDILTLTATPIPRTLNMSMSGIRDLSIIATPPAQRLSVKTFVRQSDELLIKEAILRELMRGGQVYYLHNEVKTIEKTAADLAEMIPEARIAVGHGQMRERELEGVMQDFYHKRHNVLVCTTIIETGIDIPSANTIIINRADKFGLAQLHQLRGRVGRSHHQAYAYLLTPPPRSITKDAQKRLEAIEQAHDLGAGFTLATHDLEIRGAGELLGEEQSGQIQNVGFTLFMEMLEQAVEAIKKGETPDLDRPLSHGTEINLRAPALIPDDYVPDVHTRLVFYKRIASAKDKDALNDLQIEMIDRFGLLPEPLKQLFRQTELRLRAEAFGIERIDIGAKGGRVEFNMKPNIDPMKVITLVQQQSHLWRMDGSSSLKLLKGSEKVEERFQITQNLLDRLA
ncbi:transcription-repair coupling factor [Sansalvadorimonas sp. 2012CJ34-2]|uniref:Transcription-repair-coupling factor n=1 Tax=Parendozoicomonas callyspongiae TaxID=2942213 RepID=A0ABT0PGC2_9GAMM|nr:transcription-repair coupling factor [Sansalvadorimonas sp. 2012CJ34-2]MCL6269812.1 transcription-repair coupling factor [Sansalvadorimonas sp. 2012CJ34-2]